MNIIFIYLKSFSQTGGIETFNQKFIKALEENSEINNTKVTIISLYDKEDDYKSNSKKIDFLAFNGNKLAALRALIRDAKKDTMIFYGHINLVPFANLLYLLNLNKRAQFIIHGIDVWYRFPLRRRFLMNKFSYLAVSNYTKRVFADKNDIDLSKIVVFPNCIDVDELPHISNSPYNKNKFNILSVTRLDIDDNYKGIDSIIKTLSVLKEKIPNIQYTVIGKGNDKERLEILANSLEVHEYVEFKGFVEQIEPYYEHCDLFALPSNGEGFGIVYLEAMKFNKPVIAANAGGATDVVLDLETGFLCEYDNQECLSKKIIELHGNSKLAMKLGENGYKYLLKNFTFEKFKERLIQILNDSKTLKI